MVILDPEVDERTVQPTLEKFLSVITNGEGSVDNVRLVGPSSFVIRNPEED